MKKLISMTDFVVSDKVKSQLEYVDAYKLIRNYAHFLKQPLELWMFVPCDENENILEEPKLFKSEDCEEQNKTITDIRFKQYQQAKERCLFEGFSEKDAKIALFANETTEDLIEFNLTLTQTAIKQIGL